MDSGLKDREHYYVKLFRYLYNNKQKTLNQKKEDEEFYYSDVEETRTQFTKKQLKAIEEKYDIPISTKTSFAIIEQFISFVTGTSPYPRIIANEEELKTWAQINERIVHNIWSESGFSDELTSIVRDMFVTGSGYAIVRNDYYYKESTFNVIIEHVPWTEVYIDPGCKKADLSDADFVIIAKARPIHKLEQEYGIKIDSEDSNTTLLDPQVPMHDIPDGFSDFGFSESGNKLEYKHTKWSWVKEIYEKILVTMYVSPEGYVTLEAPNEVQMPNEEKQQAQLQLQQYQQQNQQTMQAEAEQNAVVEQGGAPTMPSQNSKPAIEQASALEAAAYQIRRMPDMITKYAMKLENGQEVYADEFTMIKQKRIRKLLQVDRKILKEVVLGTDEIPLAHFAYTHYRNPNKTYGGIHFMKDFVKANNKLWGLLILDMQLRTSMRIITPESAIQEPEKWESKFAIPGSINTYTADPSLPDGGRPNVVDLSGANSHIIQLLSMLVQLAEYVTGIFGVIQGNSEQAPSTLGATQSLQNFGTQRIKLAARGLEKPLNQLIYSVVKFVQAYSDPDKIQKFIDPQEQYNANELIAQGGDAKFKVRTTITNSLPTSRQMAAHMFTTLAGQVADPMAQKLLIEYGIKFLDIREADEISQQMNTISQMQQQMAGLQDQLKQSESKNAALAQQSAQKDISLEVEKAKGAIKAEQAVASNTIDNQMQQMVDGESQVPSVDSINPQGF